MKKRFVIQCTAFSVLSAILLSSCGNSDSKNTDNKKDTTKPVRTNIISNKEKVNIEKPGIINILDTVSPKRIVLYMKDSAKTFERISIKLGTIYGVKLAEVLKKNNIKMAGAPMAWYRSQKAPYFFEAGVPVNKRPAKLPKNIFVREMGTDSVTMAHFYGPYNLLGQGYDAIKERMKDAKKTGTGAPYEIYIDDPVDATGKPKDPYRIRTDIIFPRR
jgi:effector-binding domain-containing protein